MTKQHEDNAVPTTAAPAKSGRSGALLGSVAILLTLGLTGGLYLHGHKKAVAQQDEIRALKQQLQGAASQLAENGSFARDQLASLEQKQRVLHKELQGLQSRVLDLDEKRPNDWLLAEADYLVRIAGRKLALEHDVVSTIALLDNADERIKALADPSLMVIRQALAEDIAQLKGLPVLDREGLSLKLAALSQQMDSLPLTNVDMPNAQTAPEAGVSQDVTDWQQNLTQNWLQFTENFITIRRRDGAVEALLSPEQEVYLRENVKTKLLQAQLSVYREEQALYQASLNQAQAWVAQYFDREQPATRALLTQVTELKAQPIKLAYPNALKAQLMLDNALNERLQRMLSNN
ncbi:MAG: uroporphyrinogen-III C-methyltransferase [Aeromonas sp.]